MALRIIMQGVEDDIRDLVIKFHDARTLDYGAFLKIWHEMKFYHIFSGRPCAAEMKLFTREILLITKGYALHKCLLSEKVVGIYLMYALYICQPLEITKDEYLKLEEFAQKMLQHPDGKYASFIFYALIYKHAFDYVYSEILYSREKLIEEWQNEIRYKKLGDIAKENERSEVLDELQKSEFDLNKWSNQETELNTLIDSINKMLKDNTETSELPKLEKVDLVKGLLYPEKQEDLLQAPTIPTTKLARKWNLWKKAATEANAGESAPSTSLGLGRVKKLVTKGKNTKSSHFQGPIDPISDESENENEELKESLFNVAYDFHLPSDDSDSVFGEEEDVDDVEVDEDQDHKLAFD